MNLAEIKTKANKDKENRLQRISEICNTSGNYKKNRKKPRAEAEQAILDMFASQGYY